jgi:cytochrome d ubiquinol oxidase subunit II
MDPVALEPSSLQITWFVLVGVLMAGYAILDGFDLGVGILHLLARDDTERRIFMNSIGPLWDGNEVWLVVFGGALFAAFPKAYAAAFSGFYTGAMALLCALIFRGVSMEFRSKRPWRWWRGAWDLSFCVASTGVSFLFGVVVGDCMQGLPLGPEGDLTQPLTLVDLLLGPAGAPLRGYPLMTGLFAVSTFAMHGSIYLYMKTEGALQARIRRWMWIAYFVFLAIYLIVSGCTVAAFPAATEKFHDYPLLWAVPLLNVLAILNISRAMYSGRPFGAFLSSACVIAAFTFLFGVALFPNLLVSTEDPAYSLTVMNAASTDKTLGIMLVVAGLGLPFVLTYTATIYWVFRGKVQIGGFSY